ncbi:uncharacterized protein LOC108144963 isoform X2 [Drosophila elegans]|uniref:uncharacterized protein LOC108144963 isoform X2 n=1 Tax=Drosophila elegans TaxID=30023 RepID=UPI0007E8AEED|nr:uncharacterized protein LOC108144963 isoform X2 [Drosophila elegans]
MCKLCGVGLSRRLECGHTLYDRIELGAISFGLLGACLLLLGVIMLNYVLVWIWIGIILSVIVTVVIVESMKLSRNWNFYSDEWKAYIILVLIAVTGCLLYTIYQTHLYALKLGRREERPHGCQLVFRGFRLHTHNVC